MNYITEQILSTEITTFGAIFKLLLSLCLGALIGTERRHKGQAAGMRTFALIAMGAWCWCHNPDEGFSTRSYNGSRYLDDSMFRPRHWCRNVYNICLFMPLHHRSTQTIRIL